MKTPICAICKSESGFSAAYTNLSDYVASAVSYESAILTCNRCHHSFLFPVLEGDELSKAYNGYYTQSGTGMNPSEFMGDKRFSKWRFFFDNTQRSQSLKFLRAALNATPCIGFLLKRAVRYTPRPVTGQNHLLDIGCGNGQFLLRARDYGYQVKGLDFDAKTVETARSFGLDVIYGDISVLAKSEKFNVITLSHVIEHVPEPVELIDRIQEQLAVDGYFYLATPNFGSTGQKAFGRYWRGLEYPRHLHLFEAEELSQLLIDRGFSKVELVFDLPQSLGILRSSWKIFKRETQPNTLQRIQMLLKLARHTRIFSRKSLDVIALRAWK
jgi:2-polyprenyl-3-methyl-5-hydroxy-6-metoxy-1,4-benzoquinol methylase